MHVKMLLKNLPLRRQPMVKNKQRATKPDGLAPVQTSDEALAMHLLGRHIYLVFRIDIVSIINRMRDLNK